MTLTFGVDAAAATAAVIATARSRPPVSTVVAIRRKLYLRCFEYASVPPRGRRSIEHGQPSPTAAVYPGGFRGNAEVASA